MKIQKCAVFTYYLSLVFLMWTTSEMKICIRKVPLLQVSNFRFVGISLFSSGGKNEAKRWFPFFFSCLNFLSWYFWWIVGADENYKMTELINFFVQLCTGGQTLPINLVFYWILAYYLVSITFFSWLLPLTKIGILTAWSSWYFNTSWIMSKVESVHHPTLHIHLDEFKWWKESNGTL